MTSKFAAARPLKLLAGLLALVSSAAWAATPNDPRDFEGTWSDLPTASPFLLGVDLPYKPEAQNIAADHLQAFENGHAFASAHLTCRPPPACRG